MHSGSQPALVPNVLLDRVCNSFPAKRNGDLFGLCVRNQTAAHMSLTELPQRLGGTVPGRVAVDQRHHEIAEQRRHIINGLARHVQHLSLRALQRAVQMRKLCGM